MNQRLTELEVLRAWAGAQTFSPPRWLQQADLQTSWYVIREIAAGIRDRRISARQIWKYVEGQEKNYGRAPDTVRFSHVGKGSSGKAGETDSLSGFRTDEVALPFPEEGFLTGRLSRPGHTTSLAILFHGLEGSAEGTYMRGTARRLLERGVAALRVNMVNCGGSEVCTRLFYHAGFTRMLEVSIQWALGEGFQRIALVGFSLGGNLVLKYLGNSLTNSLILNSSRRDAVIGGVAVSPPMDLALSAACIDRPRNKFYRYRFLKSMFRTLKRKQELFPDLFPHPLEWVKTITEFDHRYTARANGFASGCDYYAKASSVTWLKSIDRPTLILHARDDLYIPFETFRDYDWAQNPNLIPLFPEHGGHLGFHASVRENWMESTVAEFCRLLTEPPRTG